MKQIILATVLITMAIASYSQGLNFYDIGTAWKYKTTSQMGMTGTRTDEVAYTITSDTTVLGITYKKAEVYCKRRESTTSLNPPYNHTSTTTYPTFPPVLIRYDMNTERVYRHYNDTLPDALIYNFNLQVGDTLPVRAQSPWRIAVVDSITGVMVDGHCTKKFFISTAVADTLQPVDRTKTYIIQGIGGSNGFTTFNPANAFVRTYLQHVVYKGDTLLAFNDTCQLQRPTAVVDAEQKIFRSYPNPATNTLRIDVAYTAPADITITALDGRILAKHKAEGNTAIDVSAMMPGLYIVTVKTTAAKVSSMLFAKE